MNYIFLADGFETVEALAVVDMLYRAGVPLTMVSMNDTVDVETSHKIKLMANTTFAEVDLSDAEMLILPGGMPGTTNLQANEKLCSILKAHNEKGGWLAAICAAPSVLGQLGILENKNACCFPGFEDKLIGARVSRRAVEVSENCITSRGMGTAIQFGAAIIKCLVSEEASEKILSQIQFNTSEV